MIVVLIFILGQNYYLQAQIEFEFNKPLTIIQQRKQNYNRVLETVEKTDKSIIYTSKGSVEEGWGLPKGIYNITKRESDGEAGYELIEELPSYLTPIPVPDNCTT